MTQTSDAEPIRVECQMSGDIMQLLHDGTPYANNRIEAPSEAVVEIADYVHDDKHWRVNAYTIERGGTLTPWPRNDADDACAAQALTGDKRRIEVVLVPVAYAQVGHLTDDGIDAFTDHDYAPCRVIVEVPDPVIERPTP